MVRASESADSKRQETESSEELRQLVLVFFLYLDRPGKKSELFYVSELQVSESDSIDIFLIPY